MSAAKPIKPSPKCAGRVVGVYSEADVSGAKTRELKLILTKKLGFQKRAGCGFDLSELAAKLPHDGKVRSVECPKCGNIIKAFNAAFKSEPGLDKGE